MAKLSQAQRQALHTILEAAPDRMLGYIEGAFRSTPGANGAFVRALARDLSADRQARAALLEPLAPMFRPREDGVRAVTFPRATELALWTRLKARCPDDVGALLATFSRDSRPPSPGQLDALAAQACDVVRGCAPSDLGLTSVDEVEALAAYLEMSHRVRLAIHLIESWTYVQLDETREQQIEQAFREAGAVRYDGARLFAEMLFAHMPDASATPRFMTAVLRTGGGVMVREPEIADFGERLVDFVEALARDLPTRLKSGDLKDAETVARGLTLTASILTQFELVGWSARVGWPDRLARASQQIGSTLDSFFKTIASKVSHALPMISVQTAGRMSRKIPDLAADAGSTVAEHARAALVVSSGARTFAPMVGCEASRHKAFLTVAEYADRYADETLGLLADPAIEHRDGGERLVEMAADFLDLTHAGEAGDLVRRRLAIARLEWPAEAA